MGIGVQGNILWLINDVSAAVCLEVIVHIIQGDFLCQIGYFYLIAQHHHAEIKLDVCVSVTERIL